MAELFGVLASAAGVAGVTAQAVDGIRKLRQFCQDTRGAPEEIQYIIEELELLTNEINSIEAQICRNTQLSTHVDPSAALRFCRRSVETVNKVTQELQNEIQARRRTGSIKAAWKKKRLEAYMTAIERAKSSLSIASSTYTRELYTHGFMVMERKFDTLTTSVATSPTIDVNKLQSPVTAMASVTFSSPSNATSQDTLVQHSDSWRQGDRDDNVAEDSLIPRKRTRKGLNMRSVAKLSLRLPPWLLSRSWELDMSHAANGWTVHLREYRTVPWECDLFCAIRNCDINRTRHLLSSGEASVFDRDDRGRGVLHELADRASQPGAGTKPFTQLAQLLIDYRADTDVGDDHGLYPLLFYQPSFNSLFMARDPHQDVICTEFPTLQMLQLLVGDFEIETPNVELESTTDMEYAQFFYKHFCSDSSASFLRPSSKEMLKECRSGLPFASPAILACWLGTDELSTMWLEYGNTIAEDLIFVVLRSYSFAAALRKTEPVNLWREAFMKLVNMGLDPLSLMACACCLLDVFEDYFRCCWFGTCMSSLGRWLRHGFEVGFKSFIRHFESIGIDLSALGPKVVDQSSCNHGKGCHSLEIWWLTDDALKGERPGVDLPVYGFTVGPKAEDWNIFMSHPSDTWAGEFWDMIEHPERTMPGAWGSWDDVGSIEGRKAMMTRKWESLKIMVK